MRRVVTTMDKFRNTPSYDLSDMKHVRHTGMVFKGDYMDVLTYDIPLVKLNERFSGFNDDFQGHVQV